MCSFKFIANNISALRCESVEVKLGYDFYERELRHMIDKEWAQTLDDVIWRRSKLGLHLSQEQCEAIRLVMNNE